MFFVIFLILINLFFSQPYNFYGHDSTRGSLDSVEPFYGGIARFVDYSVGANSGEGEISSPWLTIRYALQNAQSGDTIFLRDTAPHPHLGLTAQLNSGVNMPLEIRSYPGEWAKLNGNSLGYSYMIVRDVTGPLLLRNFEVDTVSGNDYIDGFVIADSENVVLENFYVHHVSGPGLRIQGSKNISVRYSTFAHNHDPGNQGQNADGISLSATTNECHNITVYRSLAFNNSDDGFDGWTARNVKFVECVSHSNGYDVNGNGNGFKLGGNSGNDGGHTLIRCMSVGNKMRGFDENSGDLASKFYNCLSYNNANRNYAFYSAGVSNSFVNSISLNGTCTFQVEAEFVTSDGCDFGANFNIQESDFESVSLEDLQNKDVGRRFFFPKKTSTNLIDKGTKVNGIYFEGNAPDISPREYFSTGYKPSISYVLIFVLVISTLSLFNFQFTF